MAGKKNSKNMISYQDAFFGALDKLAEEKDLDREEVLVCLEEVIALGYAEKSQEDIDPNLRERTGRDYKKNVKYAAEIDRNTGEIFVSTVRTVVAEVENPDNQISLEEARTWDPEFNIGDDLYTDVTPTSFEKMGRSTASKIKTLFIQKVSDKEKRKIENECASLENEIVSCQVQSVEEQQFYDVKAEKYRTKRKVYVSLGKLEGVLTESDLLPNDQYRFGQMLKAILVKVDDGRGQEETEKKRKNKETLIHLSRTKDMFLKKLLEKEVPEIREGIVSVVEVARKPGIRSKVAVYSHDPDIDPISACVGPGGQRINSISEELTGEKIDIILWDPDLATFVANSLSPAKTLKSAPVIIEDDYEKIQETGRRGDKISKVARVTLSNDQLTLAIGSKGINVALAAMLCRCRIDIKGAGDESETAAIDRSALADIMS